MRGIVASRWFAFADLLLVVVSGAIWYVFPNLGAWLLIIALLPWVTRLAAGKFPFNRSVFDLPLGIFLATAAVGVWAAYDRAGAWAKFWLLVVGILLFYALVNQPKANLKFVAGLLGALAGGIAVFFLLTYDWHNQPADFSILNHLGLWWMTIRPAIKAEPPLPNIVGGILAMLLPYPIVLGLNAWQERRLLVLGFAILTTSLALIALLMTSSRAAWAALAVTLGCWFLWALVGRIVHSTSHLVVGKFLNQRGLYALILFLVGGFAVVLFMNSPGGMDALFNSIPGASDGGSRLTLYQNSLPLIQDFIYTGGGLGAFAGLYSRYVLVIPHFFFGYTHNLLLDIALEQGIFGVLAFSTIFLGSIWLLIPGKISQGFRWAVLASLLVIGLHGLLDDALYGERGTPLLFLSIGFALAVVKSQESGQKLSQVPFTAGLRKWWWWSLAVGGIALVFILYSFRSSLLASWYADLGAVEMARVELAGFPTGQWDDGSTVVELSPAEGSLDRAIKIFPNNRTARYRLGLIAMLRRDFSSAMSNLETAFQQDPGNRGIRKNLGYSYVWAGKFEQAAILLQTIPEARDEMDVYAWWWGTQGRDDLASNASHMVQILGSNSLLSSGTIQRP